MGLEFSNLAAVTAATARDQGETSGAGDASQPSKAILPRVDTSPGLFGAGE